jgi:hypothetical protein
MSVDQVTSRYKRLRQGAMWSLLLANNAPVVLAMLQTHLYDRERMLSTSIFLNKVARDLETLRAQGEDLPQSAQLYIRSWLKDGLLHREYPVGTNEESYSLTVDAIAAIRFASGLEQPHATATESRLSLVVNAAEQLAIDTDTNVIRRVERLQAEVDRLNTEIKRLGDGKLRVLSFDTACERTREILQLADDIIGDFDRVSDQFRIQHREMREQLVSDEGGVSDVLRLVFSEIGAMEQSEAGRTFTSFWLLLMNPEQSATLKTAIDDIRSREFSDNLTKKELDTLSQLVPKMQAAARKVQKVQVTFSESLRGFVQSKAYQEQQRLFHVLREAQAAALTASSYVKGYEGLDYEMVLTSCDINSHAQFALFDPVDSAPSAEMQNAPAAHLDVVSLKSMLAQTDIDFKSLRRNITDVLSRQPRATTAEIVAVHPIEQGLAGVAGYMLLAEVLGVIGTDTEVINWTGKDGVARTGAIPLITFMKEKLHATDAI